MVLPKEESCSGVNFRYSCCLNVGEKCPNHSCSRNSERSSRGWLKKEINTLLALRKKKTLKRKCPEVCPLTLRFVVRTRITIRAPAPQ